MKSYYKVRLGGANEHAKECFAENFIGADFGIPQDLATKLPDDWQKFNREFIPIYLEAHPAKTKVAAGLACGALWTMARGIIKGDIVLCPDGEDHYHVGEIIRDYYYEPGGILPHRRSVQWLDKVIDRSALSELLKNSLSSRGTVSTLNPYAEEIQKFIGGTPSYKLVPSDETVEDPYEFGMEAHLEDFLMKNWALTDLSKEYDIYEVDGQIVGQQFKFKEDTGRSDILALSKDKKTLLVIELKRGRASDIVVGQTLRYMGCVRDELAEEGQVVRGLIIAREDDKHIRKALSMVPNLDFYRYQVSFKLVKG